MFTSRSDALEAATNRKLQNVQMVLTREFREWEIAPIATSVKSEAELGH